MRSVQRQWTRKLLDPDTGRWSAIVPGRALCNICACMYSGLVCVYVCVCVCVYVYVYVDVYVCVYV